MVRPARPALSPVATALPARPATMAAPAAPAARWRARRPLLPGVTALTAAVAPRAPTVEQEGLAAPRLLLAPVDWPPEVTVVPAATAEPAIQPAVPAALAAPG